MSSLQTPSESQDLSPSRSRTDPPAPEMHHEKSHLHRRLHASSLRHRTFTSTKEKDHHNLRHSAKDTVQSAIELKPPISFDTLLRRDKKPANSSRRGSGSQQANQQPSEPSQGHPQQAVDTKLRRIRPEEVRTARQENSRRDEELRESLKHIEQVAMSSTRKLDDTYYSILDKASLLRSTVISLQQLAEESRKVHAQFEDDATELQKDTRTSLASFNNFAAQEERINELVRQLATSKQKTDDLNGRLETARTRVGAFEQRETEKQKASRQRWGLAWVLLIALVGILIAAVVARHRATVGTKLQRMARVIDEDITESIASALTPAAVRPREDPYLKKLFDDL